MDDGERPRNVLTVGDVVGGKYRIDALLGEGGMGLVLGAHHVHLDQRVAIKVMHASLAAYPQAVERFMREARSSVAMKGEHVARVYDVDLLPSGVPYMIMEHLDGLDFEALLEECGPLSVSEALLYSLQACEAIAEAHARGIVHRDLKPSNLFVTRGPDGSPVVKVLDFGIAKAIDPRMAGDSKLTNTGAMIGSPGYMSPEQVRDSATVDVRSDIWSLGVIVYQALAAQIPFDGDSAGALCAAIAADEPRALDEVREGLPSGLVSAVMRCLEKPRAKRFADVGELAAALAPFAPPEALRSVDRAVRMSRHGLADPDASGRWTAQVLDSGGACSLGASLDDSLAATEAAGENTVRDGAQIAATEDGFALRPIVNPSPGWPRIAGVALLVGAAGLAAWLALSSVEMPPPSAVTPSPPDDISPGAPAHSPAAAPDTSSPSRQVGDDERSRGGDGGAEPSARMDVPAPPKPRKAAPKPEPTKTRAPEPSPTGAEEHDEFLLDRK